MKKHLLLITLAAIFAMPIFAQEEEEQQTKHGPYLTNRFADNWFVEVGAGGLWNADGILSLNPEANFTPLVHANFGRWIDPNFGLSLGYRGWAVANKAIGTDWYQNHYVYMDVMWNWSNQFGGYQRTRVYNAIPYLHAGVMFGHYGSEFAAGAGLRNDFRIIDNLHLNLDLRGTLVRGEQVGSTDGLTGLLELSVGIAYHFNKAYWNRPAKPKPCADPAELAVLQEQYDDLLTERDRLSRQVSVLNEEVESLKVKGGVKRDTVVVEKQKIVRVPQNNQQQDCSVTSGPAAFYFLYGRSVLQPQEQQHLNYYIENIVNADTDQQNFYVITGYADKGTGSAKANRRMSELRANYIKKQLIKAGVKPSQIEVRINSTNKNYGATASLSRAAVIEIR